MPQQRTSPIRGTISGGSCTTPASPHGSMNRRSSSSCSSSATASRTPPTAPRPARATCGAEISMRTRSTTGSWRFARVRSHSSARRRTAVSIATAPSLALSCTRSARRGCTCCRRRRRQTRRCRTPSAWTGSALCANGSSRWSAMPCGRSSSTGKAACCSSDSGGRDATGRGGAPPAAESSRGRATSRR